jgi:hypothetical protein
MNEAEASDIVYLPAFAGIMGLPIDKCLRNAYKITE